MVSGVGGWLVGEGVASGGGGWLVGEGGGEGGWLHSKVWTDTHEY